MSKYRAIHRCIACRHELTYSERMHSGGVCPHCGRVTNGTIADTTKEAVLIEAKPARSPLTWLDLLKGLRFW